jgi:signal transduction histidine kinase
MQKEEETRCLVRIAFDKAMLVEDLLALAKTGNIEAPEAPVDVKQIVAFVVGEFEHERKKSGIEININDVPEVLVPESLLTQIFENLIGNALRYAGDDAGPIEVGGERAGNRARYFVRDHGKGIPREEQERIFNLFYRGTTGKGITGSGVGLATVQKICSHYNGKATVEDTSGGGTTFYVELMDATD